MARRRHQNPKPIREGLWWYLRVWEYSFVDGKQVRKLKRIKLAEASKKEREVRKIADEIVRPINHGQIIVGAAVNFGEYARENGNLRTRALRRFPCCAPRHSLRSCPDAALPIPQLSKSAMSSRMCCAQR